MPLRFLVKTAITVHNVGIILQYHHVQFGSNLLIDGKVMLFCSAADTQTHRQDKVFIYNTNVCIHIIIIYIIQMIHTYQYTHLCYKVPLDHTWPSSSDTFKSIICICFMYGMAGTEVVASLDGRLIYKMGAHTSTHQYNNHSSILHQTIPTCIMVYFHI